MPDVKQVRYTITGAAFLLQVSTSTVRSWANGYTVKTRSGYDRTRIVLQGDRDDPNLVSFQELIELWYVKKLTERGFRLDEIEAASLQLFERLGAYPLTKADLRTIGDQIVTTDIEPGLLSNAATLQHLFEFAVEMAEQLDYDVNGYAITWYPKKDKSIKVDPRFCFGMPTIDLGIPTRTIYERYRVEGSVESTAEWFEIESQQVRTALDFEEEWKKRAA